MLVAINKEKGRHYNFSYLLDDGNFAAFTKVCKQGRQMLEHVMIEPHSMNAVL